MAQSPDKPKDDGKIKLPKVDAAQNKLPPALPKGGKGAEDDQENVEKGSEDEKDQEILARARKLFDRCVSSESENRKEALDDLKFYAGDQWPSDIRAQRNAEKRPCLTINRLPTFVKQVTNDIRQNRPGINVSPVGDRGDPEAAKMYAGLIRFIERDCAADTAYDTAAESAVRCGFGYWRVMTEYEAPDTFNQVLIVRRIRNTFTVYLDPDHQEPEGDDAKFGFVTEMIPRDEFKEHYPDADPMPWSQAGIGESLKNWIQADAVRVAEFYEIRSKSRTLIALDNGHEGWEDELSDDTRELIASGDLKVANTRESETRTVKCHKITATEILERYDWLGTSIPIVKVIGDEVDVEGRPKYSGVIRHAKDPQRMYNYWRCLALDTPIPTPTGWTTMATVKLEDVVFDEKGSPTKVVGESPIHLHRECFRLSFDDGSCIVADRDHPWAVEERGGRAAGGFRWMDKVITTGEIVPGRHFIRTSSPLELPTANLPIDPYVLGVWLGDGCATHGSIYAGEADVEEMRGNLLAAGSILGPSRRYGPRVPVFTVLGLRGKLAKAGLLKNKHVPAAYLRASFVQRLALLQGLMDTDGSIAAATNQCSFTTTSPAISAAFRELLASLGIKAVACRREGRIRVFETYTSAHLPADQFSFTAPTSLQVFRLTRKRDRQMRARPEHVRRTKRHRIVSVERVASVPVKCIAVDSPSHLFLAGPGMVPTHNTLQTEKVALAPKAKWLAEEGQVEGHEGEWKRANTSITAVLTYKATNVNGTMAPPPNRITPEGIDAGVESALQGAGQDMQATTGIRFDATMQERMMDESGKAIRELRRSGDIGAFNYVDNLSRALRRTGRIFVEMIPKIYDAKRVLTILREDGGEERVVLDPGAAKPYQETKPQPTPQNPSPKTLKIFNPAVGKYGVTVTIGPNYATKRIEAAESMMSFARALPNVAALVADLIAKNQDWPGADEIARRLAKAVPPQYLTPDQKDIPPQVQAIMQAMDHQIKQLSTERVQMVKALTDQQADRAIKQDSIDKTFEAKILGIVQKAEAAFNGQIGSKLERLGQDVATLMEALKSPPESAGVSGAVPAGR